MLRARLPSIFSTSHKMPRLPRNLHLSPLDAALPMRFAIKTRNKTRLTCCACHAKWRWTRPKCCACHETATHPLKTSQKYCACHTKRLSTRYKKNVWIPRSATPATRNEATRTFETSKNDSFCRTYHRHGHTALTRKRLRTVAKCCERKRNVEQTHPQPPDPQSEKGTLATHSGRTGGSRYEQKKSETLKSRPHPYFWKWKINVQKIKLSVSGVCLKLKKWHKRWKQQCSACVQKTLNYKNHNFPRERSTASFSSHPASTPTSYHCLVGIANAKAFNVGISNKQLVEVTALQWYTTHLWKPILNQNPKDTPLNFPSLGLRLSSHTSLFFELCRSSSPCYTTHLCQPILNLPPKDTAQNLRP